MNCFTVVILFSLVFLTFQNRRVITSIAIAFFPEDTCVGHILEEIESPIDSNALSFHSIIKIPFLQFNS